MMKNTVMNIQSIVRIEKNQSSDQMNVNTVLKKTIENREKYKKIRKTLTDEEVVLFRKKRIYSEESEERLKYGSDKVWDDNIQKLNNVLDKISERVEYDIWERINVRVICRKEENSYRVKANQVGRTEWMKLVIEKYSVDMRSDEPVDVSDKILETKKEENIKFWIYYQEDEEQKAKKWKRGVLYKKSIRADKPISWDIETYHHVWFNKRRIMNTERRYLLAKKTWKQDRCDIQHGYIEVYQSQRSGGYRVGDTMYDRCTLTNEDDNKIKWGYETCKNEERVSSKYITDKEWKDRREFHTAGRLKNPPLIVKGLIGSRHRGGLRWRKEDRWKNIYMGKLRIPYREDVKNLSLEKVYKGWSSHRSRVRYHRDKVNIYINHMLPIRLPMKRQRMQKRKIKQLGVKINVKKMSW